MNPAYQGFQVQQYGERIEDDNEQETSEMQFEEYALEKLNAVDFASRSKAKAKPQRREHAGSSTKILNWEKYLDRC